MLILIVFMIFKILTLSYFNLVHKLDGEDARIVDCFDMIAEMSSSVCHQSYQGFPP